jgi:two-component system sensor histidine kinase ArlS
MKITTKINVLTTAWLVFILLIMNIFVFFTFMKTIVNMEEQDLIQVGHEIIEKAGEQDLVLTEDKLNFYLPDHSFIRVVGPDSKVVNQITNDQQLSKIKAAFTKKEESQLRQIQENQILIVRVPIFSNDQVVGTLEIGEHLTGLEMRKDIVLSILAVCSAIAVLLSLLGGRWLSNVIMKPISNMIKTMEEIEQSGVPKTILIQTETKDELQTMAVTFNRMIERLQDNLGKQKQFISDASHELKTPLTIIKSYADLLTRRGIENEKRAMDAIESIRLETIRMQKMTESLLDLAISEQENRLEIKSVDIIPLCQHVLEQLQNAYKREIVFTYYQSLVKVEVDEQKMKQVIIILLDNAIKYSKEKVEVFVGKSADAAVITVTDYGIGIPQEDIDHIFDRFYRVDKARSRSTGGTGLGMSIAKNIVKQHKGDIYIRSEEGKGTEIELRLPFSYTEQE